MKKKSVAIAFPTIPIIFLGGVKEDRRPIYSTMGLTITDLNEKMRTETSVEVKPKEYGIKLLLGGKEIVDEKGNDTKRAIEKFLKATENKVGLHIESNNYEIASGSSDSGLAALFAALNDVLGSELHKDELAEYAMMGSESAIRSVYGGLSEIVIDPTKGFYGVGLASDKDLESVKILVVDFLYPSRVTADQIHAGMMTHPWYKHRVERINEWVAKIRYGIMFKKMQTIFENAEENIRNAHYLLEDLGLRVRRKEMMNLCLDIEDIRNRGHLAYYLIGGGNRLSVATFGEHVESVKGELKQKGWNFKECKIASGPKIIHSE